jgi:hypothetical protein
MTLQYIGEPLSAVQLSTAAYGKEEGGYRIYTTTSGKPCKLYVIDPQTGVCLHDHEVTGSNHSWGMCVAKDGCVYIGGDGYLHRYNPKTTEVENLGVAIQGETYLWRVAADDDGNVYGGTYPGGKVFQYNISAGTFRDYGSMVMGESYARSLDVGPNNKVYVGMGSQEAAVIELDTLTGDRRKLSLPKDLAQNKFVYDLDVVGTKLFARFVDSKTLLVYDLQREECIDRIEQAAGLDVSPPSADDKVYLIRDNVLYTYDLNTLKLTPTPMTIKTGARDFGWMELNEPDFPGKSLVSVFSGGYWVYNPQTQKHKTVKVQLEGQPVAIQSLASGDDGRIYIGGYFAGGFAYFDPSTQYLSDCRGFGQSENMMYFKDKLYLGVYTGANIYRYDPQEPWASGMNPTHLFALEAHLQDRPFSFTKTESKLVIGTVPTYGQLGGALTLYDPETDAHETYRNVVPDQSPISLAYHNGLIYGGTSVWGGLGVPPKEKHGKLFIWDTRTKETVWEGIPVEGEKAVAALTFDGNGDLWGLTSGQLFKFETESKRFVNVFDYFEPLRWEELTHFWRGGFLTFDSEGFLYGNCMGTLFRFDIAKEELTVLERNVSLFARDSNGDIYVARESELHKYRLRP